MTHDGNLLIFFLVFPKKFLDLPRPHAQFLGRLIYHLRLHQFQQFLLFLNECHLSMRLEVAIAFMLKVLAQIIDEP